MMRMTGILIFQFITKLHVYLSDYIQCTGLHILSMLYYVLCMLWERS